VIGSSMLDVLKWLRFPADNRILGVGGLAIVCSLTAQLPVVAASNMSAPIYSTVVVPSRCSITTTTREIPRRDARAGSVVGAAVATCTRRPSGALTLQVSGGARNCQDIGLGQSTATVCGGSAAAAFARSLPQQRATETKAYVSLFMRGTPATETAIITIDF
jgi:hypothetical protein